MPADTKPGADRQQQPARTPNADMQAEDAGTTESRTDDGGGTAAGSVMEQEHKSDDKSDAEAGERR